MGGVLRSSITFGWFPWFSARRVGATLLTCGSFSVKPLSFTHTSVMGGGTFSTRKFAPLPPPPPFTQWLIPSCLVSKPLECMRALAQVSPGGTSSFPYRWITPCKSWAVKVNISSSSSFALLPFCRLTSRSGVMVACTLPIFASLCSAWSIIFCAFSSSM